MSCDFADGGGKTSTRNAKLSALVGAAVTLICMRFVPSAQLLCVTAIASTGSRVGSRANLPDLRPSRHEGGLLRTFRGFRHVVSLHVRSMCQLPMLKLTTEQLPS